MILRGSSPTGLSHLVTTHQNITIILMNRPLFTSKITKRKVSSFAKQNDNPTLKIMIIFAEPETFLKTRYDILDIKITKKLAHNLIFGHFIMF